MNIEKMIQSAKEYFQSGQFEKAEESCREILSLEPYNYEISLMLGEIAYKKQDYQSAEEILRQTIKYNPYSAELFNNLGLILQRRGKFEEAIKYFKKAIEINPEISDVHYNLGIAFKEKKHYDEAIKSFQNALALDENNSDAFFNLGNLYYEMKEYDHSIACYRKAIEINPSLPEAFNNLGLIFQEKGNLDEALSFYEKAIQIDQNFAMAYFNMGMVFQLQKKLDESIINYKKAIKLNPEIVHAYFNLGNIFYEKGLMDEALINYQEALQRDPNFTDVLMNIGIILHEKQHLQEAISAFRKILKLKPYDAEAHWNLSNSLLLSGDFENGWREYEWRLKVKEFEQRDFPKPLWEGSDISQKTILIYTEQGLGDAIQFVRYVALVARRAGKVILECQKELKPIFKNVKGIHQVISRGEELPEFDVHCPLLSLPYIFCTTLETIPSEIPYIFVDSLIFQKWHEKMKIDDSQLKVGLVWSGNPRHKKHYYRDFPLTTYAPFTDFKGITFYTLQKGEAGKESKNVPIGLKLIDYTEEIHDFSDTAAIIENLDLVISVDTAVAHLAGALGKPVWTLLPFAPDWRWMLNRQDSPWYPTMRLFRQPAPGDWKTVIEKVAGELNSILKKINTNEHRRNSPNSFRKLSIW